MLGRLITSTLDSEVGDTLIEVTFALAILGFVLLSSTVIATTAFRTGQTAKERTQVSQAAQAQMEALRSFRDNHTWSEFRFGSGPTYNGIEDVITTSNCTSAELAGKKCFHMIYKPTVPGTSEWVPAAGSMAVAGVPTSTIEIAVNTVAAHRGCDYNFDLAYYFDTLGSTIPATNHIAYRLANLSYSGLGGCDN